MLTLILLLCLVNLGLSGYLVWRGQAQPARQAPVIPADRLARVMSSGKGRDLLRQRLQARLDAIPKGEG